MKVIAKTPVKYRGKAYGIGETVEVDKETVEQHRELFEVKETPKGGGKANGGSSDPNDPPTS